MLRHKTVKKLTLMAVLTSAALIIFVIEAQIPLPIAVPGVKLGLANTVTLFALFYSRGVARGVDDLNVGDVFMILICRILLGALFTARMTALIYSLAGGLPALAVQAIMKRFVSGRQIWACGAVGAAIHNIGQILAAMVVTGTPAIIAYLPVLIVTGIITGVLTGLITQLSLARIVKRTGD